MAKVGPSAVYEALSNMRETFHSHGRLDDSNAKLDEVVKLFATYLAFRRGEIATFPTGHEKDLVARLGRSFVEAAHLTAFMTNEGHSIFGPKPELALRVQDQQLARELVGVVKLAVDSAFERQEGQAIDILNEAFSHFVRDNFRSNIEDAQYMTPPEVVAFMVDLAMSQLKDQRGRADPFVVMDPSCGVGSFLASFHERAKNCDTLKDRSISIVGQDKVDRMVRLTAVNMALFEVGQHRVTVGNSLALGSALDTYNRQVDLILTNPPFGARFDHAEVKTRFGQNTPFFNSMIGASAKIDSELLFIDRALELLKPGGRLFMVVPDGVVSAKGLPAVVRQNVLRRAWLRGVVELPPVTFAQAGTRTRTAIIYLQKKGGPEPVELAPAVLMATAEEIGFQVSSRKGVQIKTAVGRDVLPAVLKAFKEADAHGQVTEVRVLSHDPSVTVVPATLIQQDGWTPSHYSAKRLEALRSLHGRSNYDVVALGDIADLLSDRRRAERPSSGTPYVSVLHVIGEGIIDLKGVMSYAPKTPGLPIFPEEVIFSKINPHITRVSVVPAIANKLLCSSEFEIMKPRHDLSPYALAYILQSRPFLEQVCELTSGTSSSHNRVRTEQLAAIRIALPRLGTDERRQFDAHVEEYQDAFKSLMDGSLRVAQLRAKEMDVLGVA